MWPDSGWGRFWKTLDRRVFSAIWPERRTAPVSSKDPMEWLMGQARQLEIQYAEAALLNVESQDFPDLLALDRAYGRLRGWLRSTASSLGGKSVLRKSLKDEEKQLKSLHADLRSTLALYRELRDGGGRPKPRAIRKNLKDWDGRKSSDARIASLLAMIEQFEQNIPELQQLEKRNAELTRILSATTPPANASELRKELTALETRSFELWSRQERLKTQMLRGLLQKNRFAFNDFSFLEGRLYTAVFAGEADLADFTVGEGEAAHRRRDRLQVGFGDGARVDGNGLAVELPDFAGAREVGDQKTGPVGRQLVHAGRRARHLDGMGIPGTLDLRDASRRSSQTLA
jgi:hypothetical protein